MKHGARHLQVLRAIVDLQAENGFPPSMTQIGKRVGLSSKNTVWSHLVRLEKAGLVSRVPNAPRTLQVTPSGLERIAAETPTENGAVECAATPAK
jgi:repressor LexA